MAGRLASKDDADQTIKASVRQAITLFVHFLGGLDDAKAAKVRVRRVLDAFIVAIALGVVVLAFGGVAGRNTNSPGGIADQILAAVAEER